MGLRRRRAVRGDRRLAQLEAAHAPDVRPADAGAAADRTVEPRLGRAAAVLDRRDAGQPLAPLRDRVRLGRLQLLPRRPDSVAWHRDKIRREVVDPIVALVSIGERRRFLLRPRGGGTSRPFMLGRGDLLVTGGTAQRAWEHTVPKVAQAGPRISLAFRHGMHPLAYGD
ncbi:MAG: alpha-ketoglutarate-dependent dioxygenase AlkB [Myxococcales bacterium]